MASLAGFGSRQADVARPIIDHGCSLRSRLFSVSGGFVSCAINMCAGSLGRQARWTISFVNGTLASKNATAVLND